MRFGSGRGEIRDGTLAEGDDRRPRRHHHDGGAFGRRSAPGPDAELSGAGLSRARGNPRSGPSRGAATGERRSGPPDYTFPYTTLFRSSPPSAGAPSVVPVGRAR